MKRCQSLSPGGTTRKGQLPKKGTQCGLEEGHDGLHSVLIPTGYPWSPTRTVREAQVTKHQSLFDHHPRPWVWQFFGADDEFIRDQNGNALISVGHNSANREEIAKLIVDTVNKL